MSSEPPIITVSGVTKRFGEERAAVDDVTFEVPDGAIFGYIGPSGSGKTTTIRLLTGVYPPTEGEITVLGRKPMQFSQGTRERIGYMPQHFVLYPELTVWENLSFAASIYGMSFGRGKRLRSLLEFVELDQHRHKITRQISGGMQRRLSLAATLVHDPRLVFLDEPTAGIDPVLRRKFWDHFRELQSHGRTLFVTTQYVGETEYCDLVGVMARGKLLIVDTPAGLRHRAFGGDVVELKTGTRIDYSQVVQMRELPFVRGEPQRYGADGLRIVVDEAATALPALIEYCQQRGIPVDSIQEYMPPFDDVFVELVRGEQGDE